MATDTRKSSYAIIVYPDSCDVERLKLHLQHAHVRALLSPLHDQDRYDAADVQDYEQRVKDGTDDAEVRGEVSEGALKKPHYHLILNYGKNKKSARQVLDFVQEVVPSCRYAMPIDNLWSMTRYMCHIDDADKGKVLYDVQDCVAFGGFDDSALYDVTKGARRSAIPRICSYIVDYGIYEWVDLVHVILRVDEPSLLDALVERTNFFTRYMDSLTHRVQTGKSGVDVDAIVDDIRGTVQQGTLKEVA